MRSLSVKWKTVLILAIVLGAVAFSALLYFRSAYIRTDLYKGAGHGGVIGEGKRETLRNILAFYDDADATYSLDGSGELLPLDGARSDSARFWDADVWRLHLPSDDGDTNTVSFGFKEDTLWVIERYRNTARTREEP